MASKQIGKYQIIKSLKKGGMGIIYLANHPTLNRKVVIKKLTFRGNKEIRERFKREAEIMMDLKNDYIVNVYDHFIVGSTHYLVQEYIEGLSLDEIIKRDGALESIDCGIISYDIANALNYIHSKGVVHRDIKPGNILIDKSGHSKLTDFGIASLGKDDCIDNSSTLEILGTPTYMPPEQIENFSKTDTKSDIYSFGVVIYEMLTGLKPFMGEVNEKLFKDIKKGKYYSISRMNNKASKALTYISRKSMSKNRNKRFNSFMQIIKKLTIFLNKNKYLVDRKRISSLINKEHKENNDFKAILANKYKKQLIKKRKVRRSIILFTSLFSAMLTFTIFLYLGYGHRFLNSNKYGALIISVNSNDKPSIEDIDIYHEDSSGLKLLERKFIFITSDGNYITSDIKLKSGNYRIKSNIDGTVTYYSIFVKPYSIINHNVIEIDSGERIHRALNSEFNFFDVSSNSDITKLVKIELKSGQSYLPFNPFSDSLYSGKTYYLRVRANGYYTDNYVISTSFIDDQFVLKSSLIPKEGMLEIISNSGSYKLFINGKNKYLSGGLNQKYENTAALNKKSKYVLNPGIYVLDIIGIDGSKFSKKIKIESGKVLKLTYP